MSQQEEADNGYVTLRRDLSVWRDLSKENESHVGHNAKWVLDMVKEDLELISGVDTRSADMKPVICNWQRMVIKGRSFFTNWIFMRWSAILK